MYAKKIPVNKGQDRLIKIAEGYMVKGKKRDRYYEDLGLLSELKRNHEDVEAFIHSRIAFHLNKKNELQSKTYTKTINYSMPINKDEKLCETRYAGSLFLNKVWSDLTLEAFFNKWKFDNKKKIEYSMNDAMRLMCFSRIIEPGSKLNDIKSAKKYIEEFDLSIDNLYDSLDEIDSFSEKLTRKLSKSCETLLPGSGDSIYYDCSNFYFEIQGPDEDGLRQYGVEKNHRPDPIIEYGLLYHEKGYPIGSVTFKGNESETGSLVPLLKSSGDEATKGKIICADGGLNTTTNKNAIHSSGRNYIFVQSLKGPKIDKNIRDEMINGKNMIQYGTPDKMGRFKSYKSRWIIRTNGFQERIIVRFDPSSYDFMMKTIEKRVEHAKTIIKNPSKLSLSKYSDGKEYIERIVVDSNGEVNKTKSALMLSSEKIKKEKELAGYYAYVTDIPSCRESDEEYRRELIKNGLRCSPLHEIDIIEIAGKRVEIEDCFRVMKNSMSARPIYVRKPEHIKAHMFTVYVALTLMCILKKKYLKTATNDSIFNTLRNYNFGIEDELTYKTLYWDENTRNLSKLMGLNLGYHYLQRKEVRTLIANSKNR